MMTKSILFIGDSITENFDTRKYLSDFYTENKGVSGVTTVDTPDRLTKEWFSNEPDFIFICIGTNDLAQGYSDDYILENIYKIVSFCKAESGSSEIILTSLFPTRFNKARPNPRIRSFNDKLEELSKKTGVEFFNIHGNFTDESMRMNIPFTTDGLHLSEKAYERWAELIRAYLI